MLVCLKKRGSLMKFKDKSIIAEELVPTFVEEEPNVFMRTIKKSLGLNILSKNLITLSSTH